MAIALHSQRVDVLVLALQGRHDTVARVYPRQLPKIVGGLASSFAEARPDARVRRSSAADHPAPPR